MVHLWVHHFNSSPQLVKVPPSNSRLGPGTLYRHNHSWRLKIRKHILPKHSRQKAKVAGLSVNRRAIRHWQKSERGFKWRVWEEHGRGGTRRNQNVSECDKWDLE
ncbi:hypothetical protein CEXT_343991 [Caerostris extrusa]|uniref:Uncharacterized protein n=1 Tax=Caerostris extrusa TaxID=172846 RepID=A0AAV4VVT9_CAEEX|nr:hypothetical protein CEXT_343991 [Caerostris extrusa]